MSREGPAVIIFTGGERVPGSAVQDLPAGVVIGADSGIDHARALGFDVDVAVGDFDSVSPDALAALVASGAIVEAHAADKDATDLELALDRALAFDPARIVLVGGHGGRIDHFLGNVSVLLAPKYAAIPIEARMGSARVHVVRSHVDVAGAPGDIVTLLPLVESAIGVVTSGLRYALDGATLEPASSLGISNVLAATRATVTIDAGSLLVIQPGTS